MKSLLEAMNKLKIESKLTLKSLYNDLLVADLDTEYREEFTNAVEHFKINQDKNAELSKEDAKKIVKYIRRKMGKDDYQMDDFMLFAKKYLKESVEKPDRETVKGLLELGAIDDPDYYESLSDEEKEDLIDYWTEHYNDDLQESKALNEERYYFGEIERVKDAIKSEVMGIGHIRKALAEAYDGNEEDYSQEMIKVIGEADAYFESVEKKCEEISDRLSKAFPNRIRKLTPKEEEEIRKRIKNGEM